MEKIIKITLTAFIILGFSQCKPVKWNIKLEGNAKIGYRLINSFKASEKTKIIFDRKAFSYACYYGEDIDLSGEKLPLVLSSIHNQVVIENTKGKRRLYSNVFFEADEMKELPDENCMFDWYEYLILSPVNPSNIVIDIPYLSDLKVTETDNRIRFIYFFKASSQQKKQGYEDMRFISNWINLK